MGGITLLDSLQKDEEGSFLASNVYYTLWNLSDEQCKRNNLP